MSGLLKHRIQTLVLREFATFPSQAKDARDMIKEYRRAQRCHLVRTRVPDDPDDTLPAADSSLDNER